MTSTTTKLLLAAILVPVAVVMFAGIDTGRAGAPATAQRAAPQVDASAEAQAQREALIQQLIERDIFHRIEVPGAYPHVFVRPAFYGLNIDDKQRFVGVVWAYYAVQDPARDIVVLYDALSGKQAGQFSAALGLRL